MLSNTRLKKTHPNLTKMMFKDKFNSIERNILDSFNGISEKNISKEFDSHGQRFMTIFLDNKEYTLELCGPLDIMRLYANSLDNKRELIFECDRVKFLKKCIKGFDKLKLIKKNYDLDTSIMCLTGSFTSTHIYENTRICKELDISFTVRQHHQFGKKILIISDPMSVAQWALAH